MSEERDLKPLVQRVDALLRGRGGAKSAEDGVPVLTEIADPDAAGRGASAVDQAALEALATELERAVLERVGPEVERVIEQHLVERLNELSVSMRQILREAVAAAVARALAPRPKDPAAPKG
jgi:ribosomal protein L12E/L44/L45/RPP1/RPP2